MNKRAITITVGLVDAAGCAGVAAAAYNSGSDPATIGFDYAAGIIVGALFVLTGLPALVLTYLKRAPRAALTLALAFPAIFAILFLTAIVIFTMPT
jgi:hypothetical protein